MAEAISEEPLDVEEDFTADDSLNEIEQTGQSSELLKGDAPEDPVDMGDWEPTLF